MLHGLLILASEAAGEEESSKTLFYVAGGGLALWAVVLGAIGMSRPDWPSESVARGLMGLTAVLMVFAMASAVITG